MYLERFDGHSSFILFLHHLNELGHNLVCNIIYVPATLKQTHKWSNKT